MELLVQIISIIFYIVVSISSILLVVENSYKLYKTFFSPEKRMPNNKKKLIKHTINIEKKHTNPKRRYRDGN